MKGSFRRLAAVGLACLALGMESLAVQTVQGVSIRGVDAIDNSRPWFPDSLDPGDSFGRAIAPLGDLDGDGIGDLAVGAHSTYGGGTLNNMGAYRGAVWILFGAPGGTVARTRLIDQTSGGFGGVLESSGTFGWSLARLGDLDGDGVTELAVGTPYAYQTNDFGRVWILFLRPDGTVKTEQLISDSVGGFQGVLEPGDQFGRSLACPGDIDGDGTPDLAVGAPYDDDNTLGSGNDLGAIWILFLNPDGTVRTEQKISALQGGGLPGLLLNRDDGFGTSLASLGDLDGDGVGDLVVGAKGDDDSSAFNLPGEARGAVYVLFLRPDGVLRAKKKISQLKGGFAGVLDDYDYFGESVAVLGDLDGNGLPDLAVGASGDDDAGPEAGAVWIVDLKQDGTVASQRKIVEASLPGLGLSAASPGDVDGDGVADLSVGWLESKTTQYGAMATLFLNANGTVGAVQEVRPGVGGMAPDTLQRYDGFGRAFASLGDLDGDGVGDLAAGTPGDDAGGAPSPISEGSVWILFLDHDRSVKTYREIAADSGDLQAPLTPGDFLGSAVACLGDLDGDGLPELAVGVPGDDDGASTMQGDVGSVRILFLEADGSVRTEQVISASQGGFAGELLDGGAFGAALAAPGDVDRDGVPDLVVGQPDEDGADDKERGAIWLLFLNADGTVRTHRKITESTGGFSGALRGYDHFGASVAPLGDLDGNGFSDLVVGAPGDDLGAPSGTGFGAAWILFLGENGVVLDQRRIATSAGGFRGVLDANDQFGASVVGPGDLDGDGVVDLVVGAMGDDDGPPIGQPQSERGALWILLLWPDGTVRRQHKVGADTGGLGADLEPYQFFGSALVALGDLDGDGIGDVGCGSSGTAQGGFAHGALWLLRLTVPGRPARRAPAPAIVPGF